MLYLTNSLSMWILLVSNVLQDEHQLHLHLLECAPHGIVAGIPLLEGLFDFDSVDCLGDP